MLIRNLTKFPLYLSKRGMMRTTNRFYKTYIGHDYFYGLTKFFQYLIYMKIRSNPCIILKLTYKNFIEGTIPLTSSINTMSKKCKHISNDEHITDFKFNKVTQEGFHWLKAKCCLWRSISSTPLYPLVMVDMWVRLETLRSIR